MNRQELNGIVEEVKIRKKLLDEGKKLTKENIEARKNRIRVERSVLAWSEYYRGEKRAKKRRRYDTCWWYRWRVDLVRGCRRSFRWLRGLFWSRRLWGSRYLRKRWVRRWEQ
jgi:hypothetical protein